MGWKKDNDGISYSQIEAGTGIKSEHTIQSAILELKNKKFIEVSEGNKWSPSRYKISQTIVIPPTAFSASQPTAKSAIQPIAVFTPPAKSAVDSVAESATLPVAETANTKDIIKEINKEEGVDPLKHPRVSVSQKTIGEAEYQLSRVLGITSSKPNRNLAMERPLAHAWQVAYRSKFNEGYAWIKSVDDRGVRILEGCGLPIDEIIQVAKGMWSQPNDFDYNRSKSLGKFADKFNEFRSKVRALKPRESGATGIFRTEVA